MINNLNTKNDQFLMKISFRTINNKKINGPLLMS